MIGRMRDLKNIIVDKKKKKKPVSNYFDEVLIICPCITSIV